MAACPPAHLHAYGAENFADGCDAGRCQAQQFFIQLDHNHAGGVGGKQRFDL